MKLRSKVVAWMIAVAFVCFVPGASGQEVKGTADGGAISFSEVWGWARAAGPFAVLILLPLLLKVNKERLDAFAENDALQKEIRAIEKRYHEDVANFTGVIQETNRNITLLSNVFDPVVALLERMERQVRKG